MAKPRIAGALCVALMGLAALIGETPVLIRAQQLPPTQSVPKPAPLAGTKWMLTEWVGQRIAQDGRQPNFELGALKQNESGTSGRLEDATGQCGSSLTGVYRSTGNWLYVRVTSSNATLYECLATEHIPPGGLSSILGGEHRFRIDGYELDLLDNSGEVRARFIADGKS